MNFDLSEEQAMLRDAAARFVREAYGFEHRRKLAASEAGFSPEYWSQYADFGWLALNLPEDVGGLGCSLVETVVVMEQLGRGMALEPIVSSAVLCAKLVDLSGAQAQREALLPAVASGELKLALAASDAIGSHTRATRADGGGYRLDGRKTLAIDAPSADRLLVVAELDGAPAVFVVPADAAGVALSPYPLLNGARAADIALEAVVLDPAALLAAGAPAQAALDEALDWARIAGMAAAVGSMEACMELTAEYIKQRSQFGQTLSRFQALQHLMADMFVDAQQSRSMLYSALAAAQDPARRARAVAAAKVVIGTAGTRVGANGIQLHGGYGVTDEYAISHHYRQLLVLDRLYGSADEHLAALVPSDD